MTTRRRCAVPDAELDGCARAGSAAVATAAHADVPALSSDWVPDVNARQPTGGSQRPKKTCALRNPECCTSIRSRTRASAPLGPNAVA